MDFTPSQLENLRMSKKIARGALGEAREKGIVPLDAEVRLEVDPELDTPEIELGIPLQYWKRSKKEFLDI